MEKERKPRIKGLKLNHKFNIIIVGFVLVLVGGFTIFIFQNMENTAINEQRSNMECIAR